MENGVRDGGSNWLAVNPHSTHCSTSAVCSPLAPRIAWRKCGPQISRLATATGTRTRDHWNTWPTHYLCGHSEYEKASTVTATIRSSFFTSSIFTLLFSLLFSLHLLFPCLYFILAVSMCKCSGKHSFMSSTFPTAIVNGTCSLCSAKTAIRFGSIAVKRNSELEKVTKITTEATKYVPLTIDLSYVVHYLAPLIRKVQCVPCWKQTPRMQQHACYLLPNVLFYCINSY